jgi:hypothetical protein
MAPAEAVRRFLDALQVPPERIPTDLDEQAALYRSQLAGRRMLVVLDNTRDTAQVRPLLPGAPTCLVLVTSRNQLTSLIATDGAHPITLGLLTDDEARQLLALRLGVDRVAAGAGGGHGDHHPLRPHTTGPGAGGRPRRHPPPRWAASAGRGVARHPSPMGGRILG